ncbi:MAG: glycosyltransferase family 1 protein [Candidatus Gottesmanbacteria bacterium]
MHIAIDISPLSSGHQGRGTGVYTKELIKALQTYESQHTYQLVDGKDVDVKKADLIHYPYFDPFFLTLPVIKKKPTVVTVHDLIPLVFPDKFPAGIRGNIKWQIQKTSLLGATRIITDSDSSKRDIHIITGFDEQKIDRVYLAQSDVYKPIGDKTVLIALRKKYAILDQFMLYVGDVNWNKNIPGLLRAYAHLLSSNARLQVKLVLVGKAFTDMSLKEIQDIHALIQELGIKNQIILPGFVSEEDLAGLYSIAQCLVQPSYYEGFGLPVLEALACGCPVVAADNSSLSEIMGPAIHVHADKTESIANGIQSVLSLSSKEKDVLRVKGFDWVKQYTWKKTAHETVQVYERSVT